MRGIVAAHRQQVVAMSDLREAIRFSEEYGFNRWLLAQDELNDLEEELRGMRVQLDELHRHNDRLHRRLEQGTDVDSLKGEVRKAREKEMKQRRRAERAELNSERLRAAYTRLVERLRLATPQSLMEVTPDAGES